MKSMRSIESMYSEPAANAALVLIRVACGLLARQLTALAKSFEVERASINPQSTINNSQFFLPLTG
jgi:hypothetical protein